MAFDDELQNHTRVIDPVSSSGRPGPIDQLGLRLALLHQDVVFVQVGVAKGAASERGAVAARVGGVALLCAADIYSFGELD